MIGAILGDIVGSPYEFDNIKTKEFELFGNGCNFTDDTVLTIATADWLLHGGNAADYYQRYGVNSKHVKGGFGGSFKKWMVSENPKPYNSWGNGSAMRISPVGWFCTTLEQTLEKAKESAECTHNHVEGIKGAQSVASAIFLLIEGKSKEEVKEYIETTFEYDLNRTCDEIRPKYRFDVSCQGTVPEAFIAFLESTSFEDAIRLAVSLGGDCDTLTCICGALAEAYYTVPDDLQEKAMSYLPKEYKKIVEEFYL